MNNLGKFFLIFLPLFNFAQGTIVKGRTVDFFSKKPIPFTSIQVNDSINYLSDINGEFLIPNAHIKKLKFKHYPELPLIMVIDSTITKELEIRLFPLLFNQDKEVRDIVSDSLIKKVIEAKQGNYNQPHSYSTYNKFQIDTDEQQTTTQILNNIIKKFSKKRIHWEGGQHHFFLMESLSEKLFENKTNQKETVFATRVTGLENTALFNINSGLQFLSVYNTQLNIANHLHVSPLSNRGLKRYDYKIIDTIQEQSQTLVVIKFTPNKRTFFEGLQGLLYVNSKNLSVQYFQVAPIGPQKSKIEVAQKYEAVGKTEIRFPVITTTSLLTKETTNHKIRLLATFKSYIYNFHELPSITKSSFDDCLVEYQDSSDYKSDSIWNTNRQEQFNNIDKNTISFFQNLGNFKKVDKVINVGSRIYSGLVPIRYVNLRLNKLLNYNDFEGLRLGLGLETNEKFNKKYGFGGYYGYGLKDNLEKYGLNTIWVINKKTDLQLKTLAQKELFEPGYTEFIFDKLQYSSEPLRQYRIPRMDYTEKYNLITTWTPIKYLKTFVSYQIENLNPQYTYFYESNNRSFYKFNELGAGFRYAFGEKCIKYEDKKVVLSTKFPVVQLQYYKGIFSTFGDFNYTKIDIKISYDRKILGYGRHIIQVVGGYAEGNLPYMKLYNSKGSFRNFYAVIHNSFETMAFNEFVSNQYTSLFYTIFLGKLNKFKRFRPSLELSQNIGYGALNNKNKHEFIQFKTMEKGFFESGITLGNLIEIHSFGLKTGLGISLYYRYGAYAFAEPNRNLIIKLATNFRI